MDESREKKQAYNFLLKRWKKACTYFDDETILNEEKLKYVAGAVKLTYELSEALHEIGTYTREEALNGFEVAEVKKTA